MILTEIFVVMCTTSGTPCINYVDVTRGVLSVIDCEHAIQEVVRDHGAAALVLHRDRSACTPLPVNTQNDLAS
jgi:hypothetical protein